MYYYNYHVSIKRLHENLSLCNNQPFITPGAKRRNVFTGVKVFTFKNELKPHLCPQEQD